MRRERSACRSGSRAAGTRRGARGRRAGRAARAGRGRRAGSRRGRGARPRAAGRARRACRSCSRAGSGRRGPRRRSARPGGRRSRRSRPRRRSPRPCGRPSGSGRAARSGHSWPRTALWAAIAAWTAVPALRKTAKNESPWRSISTPPASSNARPEELVVEREELSVLVSAQVLQELGRALDVREQEGDGAGRKCVHSAWLPQAGGAQSKTQGTADSLPPKDWGRA